MSVHRNTGSRLAPLALAALGVVYGDIGTSPLYALRESLNPAEHGLTLDEGNVLGVLSLIVWSLILLVAVKYVTIILRADNDGEGGILALTTLVSRSLARDNPKRRIAVVLGLFGAALLTGLAAGSSPLETTRGTPAPPPTPRRRSVQPGGRQSLRKRVGRIPQRPRRGGVEHDRREGSVEVDEHRGAFRVVDERQQRVRDGHTGPTAGYAVPMTTMQSASDAPSGGDDG